MYIKRQVDERCYWRNIWINYVQFVGSILLTFAYPHKHTIARVHYENVATVQFTAIYLADKDLFHLKSSLCVTYAVHTWCVAWFFTFLKSKF